jgi:hypothetical protein
MVGIPVRRRRQCLSRFLFLSLSLRMHVSGEREHLLAGGGDGDVAVGGPGPLCVNDFVVGADQLPRRCERRKLKEEQRLLDSRRHHRRLCLAPPAKRPTHRGGVSRGHPAQKHRLHTHGHSH